MNRLFPIIVVFISFGCISRGESEKRIGDLSYDLLSDNYDTIIIEIDYQSGAMPNVSSVAFFKDIVESITGKRVVISIDDEINGSDIVESYTSAKELMNPISKKYRDFMVTHRHYRYILSLQKVRILIMIVL